MTKPMIRIHNAETDEVIDREMNDVEFAQYQADQERYATEATEATTKAAQRQTLLTRLGITEDEARLLLD
jgi:hypothetical protein